MSTNFPSSLDTLTNPISTDPVTNPSHASQHANANDAIEALEAKVGVDSSAVTTSLDYKLKSTSSTDPGHKHTPTTSLVISGTPDGTKFLRDDNTWAVPAGGGDVAGPGTSVDSEIVLFNGTGGDTLKRASTTGILKATSGVLSAAVSGTDYVGISGGYAINTQLGSGSPSSANYLRGDNTWQTIDTLAPDYVQGTYIDYNNYWNTSATPIDADLGWTVSVSGGGLTNYAAGVYLGGTQLASAYVRLMCNWFDADAPWRWDDNPTMRIKYIYLSTMSSFGTTPIATTDRVNFHGFAETGNAFTYGDITDVSRRIGFAHYNGLLYTVTADGSSVTANSHGAEPGTSTIKEFMIVANIATPSIAFYMNGSLLATHTTNVPGSNDAVTLNFSSYDAASSQTGFFIGTPQLGIRVT